MGMVCRPRVRVSVHVAVLSVRTCSAHFPGTDFAVQKYSNHRGEYTDVLLRLRTVSIVKLGPNSVNVTGRQVCWETLRRRW